MSVRPCVCLFVCFRQKLYRKSKHILCSVTFFFLKSCRLWDNVEKYCRAGQATDGNMAHAHCMLDTWGYKHTLTICNTHYFSTTTIVSKKRHIVVFYVHCPSPFTFRSQGLCKLPVAVPFQTNHLQSTDVPPSDAVPIFPSLCIWGHKSRHSLFCALFLHVHVVMRGATVMHIYWQCWRIIFIGRKCQAAQ